MVWRYVRVWLWRKSRRGIVTNVCILPFWDCLFARHLAVLSLGWHLEMALISKPLKHTMPDNALVSTVLVNNNRALPCLFLCITLCKQWQSCQWTLGWLTSLSMAVIWQSCHWAGLAITILLLCPGIIYNLVIEPWDHLQGSSIASRSGIKVPLCLIWVWWQCIPYCCQLGGAVGYHRASLMHMCHRECI